MDIAINAYTGLLGGTEENYEKYRNELVRVIQSTIDKTSLRDVRMYDLEGKKHDNQAGRRGSRLVIYNNATTHESSQGITLEEEVPIILNGTIYESYKQLLGMNVGERTTINIESDNGIIIAQFFPDDYEVNIIMDLFPEYNEKYVNAFRYIMSKVQEIFDAENNEFLWNRATSKDSIIESIKTNVNRGAERRVREAKRNLEADESSLIEYRRKVKMVSDRIAERMRIVDSEGGFCDDVFARILNDMDLIANHNKVRDVMVKDGRIIVFTNELIITSDRGNRYIGGKFEINIDLESSDIRFKGSERRQGYWTNHDPHPHVNGDSGEPCWGNTSSTIAELSSQKELYALAMFCIDYLEAANTEDTAGKRVENWRRAEGEVGNAPITNKHICAECGSEFYNEDALHQVYHTYYQCHDEVTEGVMVCEDCIEEYYDYNVDADENVREVIEECEDCRDVRLGQEDECDEEEESDDEDWEDDDFDDGEDDDSEPIITPITIGDYDVLDIFGNPIR